MMHKMDSSEKMEEKGKQAGFGGEPDEDWGSQRS